MEGQKRINIRPGARAVGGAPDGLGILDYRTRSCIKPGTSVRVVQKQDQPTGKLTEGIVRDILTNSPTHPHGIKVRLTSGVIGRVKEILPPLK
jgi:uncharacterized repeat protein (TIGR03833 family)